MSSPEYRPSARAERVTPFLAMEFAKHADALKAKGVDVIRLNIGEPDFGAPPMFLSAMSDLIDGRSLAYTPAVGIDPLRSAIAAHYRRTDGLDIDPRRICVTSGASAALLLCTAALINPGDGVLVGDPSYPCNRQFAESFGADVTLIPADAATRFQLDVGAIADAWQPDTRGVMLASPSNPTGTSLPIDELADIGRCVAERGGWRIVDEIYLGLAHADGARSVLTVDDDAIVVNSFSKMFGLTGWRLGWCVVPDAMVSVVEKLAQNYYICPSTPAQYAALSCFTDEGLALAEERRQTIVERKAIVLQELSMMGLPVPVEPDGAFYVYIDVSGTRLSAWDFCTRALAQAHVALTPGNDFGHHRADDYVRLSYTVGEADLRAGLARLGNFVRELSQS